MEWARPIMTGLPDYRTDYTQNRSKFLFFIPLEIDIEGIEMASKRSKMPQTPFSGDFGALLVDFGGFAQQFSRVFGAIIRQKAAKMGSFRPKKKAFQKRLL